MASISKDAGRDGFRLSFYGTDKRKRSIWLGGFSKRLAEAVKTHVEHILVANAAGVAVDLHTAKWLGTLDAELRGKLAQAGLLQAESTGSCPTTLKAFLDYYIDGRKDTKAATRTKYGHAAGVLVRYFGGEKRLDTITPGDAERWRVYCRTKGNVRDSDRTDWSDNTVRRMTGFARQFFAHAVKQKVIATNPFDGLPASVRENRARQHFVTRDELQKVLDAVGCTELRAAIALSRFGGLRVPSELVALKWSDIDFEAGRMTIRSSKTEHHEDGGIRFCPVFPELKPFLEALRDLRNPGIECPNSAAVFTRWRLPTQNLRTALRKALEKAGIKPWEKLWHAMRASRQTELLAEFPAKDVCDWLGNSQAVAMKFYAMATSDTFQRAVCCSTRGSISATQEQSRDIVDREKPLENSDLTSEENLLKSKRLDDTGLEPVTSTMSTWRSNQLS